MHLESLNQYSWTLHLTVMTDLWGIGISSNDVIEPLECLNVALQSQTLTIAKQFQECFKQPTMSNCWICARKRNSWRLWMQSRRKLIVLNWTPLHVSPRKKKTPKRLTGPADDYNPPTSWLNSSRRLMSAFGQLNNRLLESSGIQRYKELEMVLISGNCKSVGYRFWISRLTLKDVTRSLHVPAPLADHAHAVT